MTKNQSQINVGVLLYEDVFLLDAIGPIEVFNDVNLATGKSLMKVITIAQNKTPIKSHTSLILTPDLSFEDECHIDVLVIPGGDRDLCEKNPQIKEWILKKSNLSDYVMSVCTGSLIIAKLGFLEGLKATTWNGAKKDLQAISSKIEIVNERITDCNGIITTAGISAGIDGAFYLLNHYFGFEVTLKTASFMEWELNCHLFNK